MCEKVKTFFYLQRENKKLTRRLLTKKINTKNKHSKEQKKVNFCVFQFNVVVNIVDQQQRTLCCTHGYPNVKQLEQHHED
jgi:hypothetical protein